MSNVAHYMTKGAECIDILRDALTSDEFEGYCKGNIIKYLYRAGDKQDKARDLAKAADLRLHVGPRYVVKRGGSK